MPTSNFFDDQILMINSTEMDFLTAIEGDVRLPIAMKDWNALDAWVRENMLSVQPIGRRKKAVVVSGNVKGWGYQKGIAYSQIWVAVHYRSYRDAMKACVRRLEGSDKNIHLYDADHAVSQARLAEVWPEAWVNLIIVKRSINRAVGAMLEKDLLDVIAGQERIEINAECILKAFLNREGALTKSDLALYLRACRTRFVSLAGKTNLTTDGSVSDDLVQFAMSEHASEFFAKISCDLGIQPNEALPQKQMIVIYGRGPTDGVSESSL